MPHTDPPSTPDTPQAPSGGTRLHERIFDAGVVILVAGVIGAVLIYVFSAEDADRLASTEIAGGRAYEFQIERIGGKATVYVVRFNQWLGNLWHGRQLAWTVGVLAIVISLVCFRIARMVSARSPGEADKGGDG
jgi:hypothetical protein